MSWEIPCVTQIPMRADGTAECEHIGEEHLYSEAFGFGECKFCPCGMYEEGVDVEDEEGF